MGFFFFFKEAPTVQAVPVLAWQFCSFTSSSVREETWLRTCLFLEFFGEKYFEFFCHCIFVWDTMQGASDMPKEEQEGDGARKIFFFVFCFLGSHQILQSKWIMFKNDLRSSCRLIGTLEREKQKKDGDPKRDKEWLSEWHHLWLLLMDLKKKNKKKQAEEGDLWPLFCFFLFHICSVWWLISWRLSVGHERLLQTGFVFVFHCVW